MTGRPGVSAAVAGVFLIVIVALFVVIVGVARSSPVTGRINVTGTLVYSAGIAAGSPGRGGDATTQAWRVSDKFGRRIGRWVVLCRWVLPRSRLCSGELSMPLGKLTVAGSSSTPFEGEYAVTGGTGSYRDAGGVMLFTATGLRKSVLLITITTT